METRNRKFEPLVSAGDDFGDATAGASPSFSLRDRLCFRLLTFNPSSPTHNSLSSSARRRTRFAFLGDATIAAASALLLHRRLDPDPWTSSKSSSKGSAFSSPRCLDDRGGSGDMSSRSRSCFGDWPGLAGCSGEGGGWRCGFFGGGVSSRGGGSAAKRAASLAQRRDSERREGGVESIGGGGGGGGGGCTVVGWFLKFQGEGIRPLDKKV